MMEKGEKRQGLVHFILWGLSALIVLITWKGLQWHFLYSLTSVLTIWTGAIILCFATGFLKESDKGVDYKLKYLLPIFFIAVILTSMKSYNFYIQVKEAIAKDPQWYEKAKKRKKSRIEKEKAEERIKELAMSKNEAKVICKNAFEGNANFKGSDIYNLSITAQKSNNFWLVKVPGTMKNAFGVDMKKVCVCEILTQKIINTNYSSGNIKSFYCN